LGKKGGVWGGGIQLTHFCPELQNEDGQPLRDSMSGWLTDHFLSFDTLALNPERQSAETSKLKMVG